MDAGMAIGRGTAALRGDALQRAAVQEILMGAQDNLTNVLAVMLGVSIGSGRGDLVALAGMSAAVAEAVSMGGVLYSSSRASENRDRLDGLRVRRDRLSPAASGILTFAAALVAGMVPLLPFALAPLRTAVPLSVAISILGMFGLGAWTGRLSGVTWWRDGLRLILVAGVAAGAAAFVATILRVQS